MEVGLSDGRDADRLIRYATAGVGVFGGYSVLIGLYTAVVTPVGPGPLIGILVLYAVVAPPGLWLLLSAARNRRPRGRYWLLAAIAVVVLGALPVLRADAIRGLYLLLPLVLTLVRPPWSFLVAPGLVAAPAPLAVAFDRPTYAGYLTLGLLIHGVPVAVLVWLAARARELRDVREAVAREAVARERERIDGEPHRTLGVALDAIALRAGRAGELARRDPTAAAREVGAVTDNARGTLAEARRMVARYRTVSLRAELDRAAALLSAAGIRTTVDLPEGAGSQAAPETLRSAVRTATARLLGTDAVRECVISVQPLDGGGVALDIRGDGRPVVPC